MPGSPPNRVRQLRKARDLKPQDIAVSLGVDPTTVQRWERGGTIPDERKRELAELLGVTRAHLMGWDEEDAEVAA